MLRHSCDQLAPDQWLQVCLERVCFFLGINFIAVHIERKGLYVLRFLGRVFNCRLGPFEPTKQFIYMSDSMVNTLMVGGISIFVSLCSELSLQSGVCN